MTDLLAPRRVVEKRRPAIGAQPQRFLKTERLLKARAESGWRFVERIGNARGSRGVPDFDSLFADEGRRDSRRGLGKNR
jgi:hypothetical protein